MSRTLSRSGSEFSHSPRGKAQEADTRSHVFVQTGYDQVELSEVGPRFSMRIFEIRAGTLDNKNGDVEWHLSNFTRTGRKKDYL